MLAIGAFYCLSRPIGVDTDLSEDSEYPQPFIELLQSIVLTHSLESYEFAPVLPADFHKVITLTKSASQAFAGRRLQTLAQAKTETEKSALMAQELFRLHTQGIRNWGSPTQMVRITRELFSTLEDAVERIHGVRVSALLTMIERLTTEVERRSANHFGRMRTVLSARTVSEMIDRAGETFCDSPQKRSELKAFFKSKGATLEQVRYLVTGFFDQQLCDVYLFSLADISDACPSASQESLRDVLTGWSLSFGELHDEEREHLFMNSPIQARPVVRLDEDTYYVPLLPLLHSFQLELMEGLIRNDAKLWQKYLGRRGKYLEQHAEKVFRQSLPSAQIYHGSLWDDPRTGKTFENDILIVAGSFAIAVEAKAGRVAPSAKRGGLKRIDQTVTRLVAEPAEQGTRFLEFLRSSGGIHRFKTKRGDINEVDLSHVCRFTGISLTLDWIPGEMLCSRDLQRAGLLSDAEHAVPTMCLTDLETIADVLGRQSLLVHYLSRRWEFEQSHEYMGDELDLLVLYLKTGFNLGRLEEDDRPPLMLYGLSSQLNEHQLRDCVNVDLRRMSRPFTEWWSALIDRTEAVDNPFSFELACVLLEFSHEEQVRFERKFQEIKSSVRRCGNRQGSLDSVVALVGPQHRRTAFVAVACRDLSTEERHGKMGSIGDKVVMQDGATRAVVIAVDVDDVERPYATMAFVERPGIER